MPHAVVSFDLKKQRTFNYGQIYVALSRVTSLKCLFLTGQYKQNSIKSNPKNVLFVSANTVEYLFKLTNYYSITVDTVSHMSMYLK